nr:hypothetical protein DV738_g1153 [Ipomoea batatas]
MVQQQVFRLYVPVNHMFLVAIGQCLSKACNVLGGLFFRKGSGFAEFLVELAAVSILQDQENPLVVMEPAEEPQNIGMAETALDLQLPSQLMMQPVLLYLLFKNYLQCHYILALQIQGEVDAAEFALSERFSDLEIVDGPLLFEDPRRLLWGFLEVILCSGSHFLSIWYSNLKV